MTTKRLTGGVLGCALVAVLLAGCDSKRPTVTPSSVRQSQINAVMSAEATHADAVIASEAAKTGK